MKWPWRRRRGGRSPGQVAADRALHRAHEDRQEAEDRQPAVTETADQLRRYRQENHFADMFRRSIEGRQA
ncbi:hypothetical protein [Streptomyces sp. NPDC058373]|uniref:DUF7620 family protein n=1 Tax=Streptomyces sp. NPDC058373 TaxID=3346465 RepID=UPI00364C8596